MSFITMNKALPSPSELHHYILVSATAISSELRAYRSYFRLMHLEWPKDSQPSNAFLNQHLLAVSAVLDRAPYFEVHRFVANSDPDACIKLLESTAHTATETREGLAYVRRHMYTTPEVHKENVDSLSSSGKDREP
jgi:hypothetical protein